MTIESSVSLAPGFSRVFENGVSPSRFNGLLAGGKPLKRFSGILHEHTGLKPGANERKDRSLVVGQVKITFAVLLSFLLFGVVQGFSQGRIHFNGPPPQPPGTAYGVTNYSESGASFTPVTPLQPGVQFTRNGGGIAGFPENGTPFVQGNLDGIRFSFDDESLFDLLAVELAGYSTDAPDFEAVFIGYKFGGGTVTNTFTGIGINFVTYQFGPEFTGLTRVEVPSFGSLDNLDFLVPEPNGLVLALLGGIFTFSFSDKSKKLKGAN